MSVALFGTAAGLGGWWLLFRATHVVAAYAFVKGGVVQVGAPVDGQVVSVEVVPGQRVKAGDVLVRFNDTRERAVLNHARASLEEARLQVAVERAHVRVLYAAADVTSTQVKARIEVSEAEAQVATIDAELALAKAERTSRLREQDIVPQEESEVSAAASLIASGKAEQAKRRVQAAKAQLGTARLQQAQAKAREARLELLQAAADTADAEVRAAEAALALRTVYAARDGVISRRLVEPGSAVRIGGPLLEVRYDEDLSIEAWIDESLYSTIDPNAVARARLVGLEDQLFEGELEWLGVVTEDELKDAAFSIPVAKKLAQSRWIRARIKLERRDPRLFPGLTADVSVPRGSPFSWALGLVFEAPRTLPTARAATERENVSEVQHVEAPSD